MTFAEDKLKKYIDRNLRKFHCIDVEKILNDLPCLTVMDKQKLIRTVKNDGNNTTVWHLFDTLQSREDWVEYLIRGLQEQNLQILAEEIQQVYESHQIGPRRHILGSLAPSFKDMGDCKTPVQETNVLSKSNEKVVKPKVRNSPKPEPSTPVPSKSSTTPSHARGTVPLYAQAIPFPNMSPSSQDVVPLGPREIPKEKMLSTTPASSRSSEEDLGQHWHGRQKHPVCVENGRFGIMNHPPSYVASPEHKHSENQPEENSYSAFESSPLSSSSPGESQAKDSLREKKIQALRGYQNDDLVDAGLCDSPNAAKELPSSPLWPLSNTSDLQFSPRNQHVPRVPSTVPPSSSSTQVIPPSLPAALSGVPSNVYSRDLKPVEDTELPLDDKTTSELEEEEMPRPRRIHNHGSSRGYNVFQSNLDDDVPCKPGILTPDSDESMRESADPNWSSDETKGEYSGRSDRLCLSTSLGSELLSDPIMLSDSSQSGLPEKMCPGPASSGRDVAARIDCAPKPAPDSHLDDGSIRTHTEHAVQPPSVDLTGAPDKISSTSIPSNWSLDSLPDSVPKCQPTKSASSCKPGILTPDSDESMRESADPNWSSDETKGEYSRRSDRLCLSTSLGSELLSDPIMLSDSSQSGLPEEMFPGPASSGRDVSARIACAVQPAPDGHLDDGSIRTHTEHAVQPPSVDLTGAPDRISSTSIPSNCSLDSLPDSVPKCQPTKSASSCKPGILTPDSDESMRESADPNWSSDETKGEYSRRSDRLCLSTSLGSELLSDPIMLSDSSQSGLSEEMCPGPASSRRDVLARIACAVQPAPDSHLDDGSIRTHTERVVQLPSVDLTGAPDRINSTSIPSIWSLDSLPDSVPKCQPIKSARPPTKNSEDSSNRDLNDEAPFTMSTSTLLVVGFALASVAAMTFVVLRRLKK